MIDELNNPLKDNSDLKNQDPTDKKKEKKLVDWDTDKIEDNVAEDERKSDSKKTTSAELKDSKQSSRRDNSEPKNQAQQQEKKLVDWDTDKIEDNVAEDGRKSDSKKTTSAELKDSKQSFAASNNTEQSAHEEEHQQSETEEFSWDNKPSTFQDEDQVYMNLKQELFYIRKSCSVMLEKNIASEDMQKAIDVLDSLVNCIDSPLPELDDKDGEDGELL